MIQELEKISDMIPNDMLFDGSAIVIPEVTIVDNNGKVYNMSRIYNWATKGFKDSFGSRVPFENVKTITSHSPGFIKECENVVRRRVSECFIH